MSDWYEREHRLFKDGYPVGSVRIHPTVKALMEKHQLDAWENWSASEPRWEVSNGRYISFAGDPNEAVVDCVGQIRGWERWGKAKRA